MPWTNFPNGVSLTTTTGTVDGHLLATTGSVTSNFSVGGALTQTGAVTFSSTLTIGSGTGIIGAFQYIPVFFAASSALQQIAVSPGFSNVSLDAVYMTVNTVSALVANYTIQVGSAGAVAVATVANTTSSVGVVQSLATTATTFDGTASALVCIRSVQGTAGDTTITLAVRRTA